MNWGFEQATWKRFLLDQLPCKLHSCEAKEALSEQSAQSGTPTERGWRCTETFFLLFQYILFDAQCCGNRPQGQSWLYHSCRAPDGLPQAERRYFCPRSSGKDLDFGLEAGKWTGWHTFRGFFLHWRTVLVPAGENRAPRWQASGMVTARLQTNGGQSPSPLCPPLVCLLHLPALLHSSEMPLQGTSLSKNDEAGPKGKETTPSPPFPA